jgi:hypothetical protein
MTDGEICRGPLLRGFERRQFLKMAGLSSAALALGGPLALAAVRTKEAVPRITFDPVPFPCGNTPFGGPYYPSEESTRQVGTKALYDKAKVWPIGQQIVVRFLNGQGDSWVEKIHRRIEEIAPMWCDYANLGFRFVNRGPCHITINFYPFYDSRGYYHGYGLYDSFIGKDAMSYIKNVQTMNLVFDPSIGRQFKKELVNSEFHRVILHEFGHVLGLIHEHMRPDRPIQWNKTGLYAYANRNWGWDEKTVDQQIIQTYSGNLAGTAFDVRSIMEYQFERGLAYYKDGRPFEAPYNCQLSALDKVAATITYPKVAEIIAEEVLAPGAKALNGSIKAAGQVGRYRFKPGTAGNLTIETGGRMAALIALLTTRSEGQGRGAFGNVVSAAESPAGEGGCRLRIKGLKPNGTYYIEVRNKKPLVGTGDFAITVRKGA